MQSVFILFLNNFFYIYIFFIHFYFRAPIFLRIQAIREIRKY